MVPLGMRRNTISTRTRIFLFRNIYLRKIRKTSRNPDDSKGPDDFSDEDEGDEADNEDDSDSDNAINVDPEHSVEEQEQGWQSILNKFASHVEAKK